LIGGSLVPFLKGRNQAREGSHRAGGGRPAGAGRSSVSRSAMRFCTLWRSDAAVCDFIAAKVSRRSRNCFSFSPGDRLTGWLSERWPSKARMFDPYSWWRAT
jgi:hypothetical protein